MRELGEDKHSENAEQRQDFGESKPGMMATLPPTANPSQQPLNLEDEDGILDEYDQYSLAHPYVGKVCVAAPWSALPLLTHYLQLPFPSYSIPDSQVTPSSLFY